MISLDPTTLILICGGCGLALVVLFILPLIMNVIDVVFSVLEIGTNLINLGPVPGCGCILLVLGCGCSVTVAYVLINALSTCGTAQAVNFCQFF